LLYLEADTVHDFSHVERVYWMALQLAEREAADREVVAAAALLHDVIGSSPGSGQREEHHLVSALFAESVLVKQNWKADKIAAVQHCIRAHRFRSDSETPESIEAKVLFDADKLDVLGAAGVARTIAYAAHAGEPIYTKPSDKFMASGEKENSEPHSAYHEYIFKLQHIKDRMFTASGRKMAAERHDYLVGFFERLAWEMSGAADNLIEKTERMDVDAPLTGRNANTGS
jgi:uncharacterized protein